MEICARRQGDVLYVFLSGELDEHAAANARRKIDGLLGEYAVVKKAVFDLSGVSFMDSTGIGFLLGRYKYFQRFGIPVYITNPGRETDKILTMGGIYTLLPKL